MKREDFTNELFCKNCGHIGKIETFGTLPLIEEGDIVYCPLCHSENVIAASSVDWCDNCQESPTEEESNVCANCREELEERVIRMMR